MLLLIYIIDLIMKFRNLLILSIIITAAVSLDLNEEEAEEEAFLSFPDELQTLIEEGGSNGIGESIADFARKKKGSPYEYGAMGPNKFDCSGLSQ